MSRLDLTTAGRMRLEAELALWRYGWRLPLVGLAVLAALGLGLVWLPLQYSGLGAARAELVRSEALQAQGVGQSSLLPPLQQFRSVLASQDATPTQLREIHQKAIGAGLSVAQLDVRRQQDSASGVSQLQVSLPLKGTYPALKQFCTELLAQMPSVSIDQLIIKREQVNSNVVEAQLTLSIWQQAPRKGAR